MDKISPTVVPIQFIFGIFFCFFGTIKRQQPSQTFKNKTKHYKTKQNKTKHYKTKHSNTNKTFKSTNITKQKQTKQNKTKQTFKTKDKTKDKTEIEFCVNKTKEGCVERTKQISKMPSISIPPNILTNKNKTKTNN